VVETQTEFVVGERRCIGLDVHREFAQVAVWQGGLVWQAGRFSTTPEGVRAFAEQLGPADEVALEATGNTWAIATLLASRAGRVVVSNPAKTRAIAEAKVKTDKVDAQILAQLLAADYLPAVWLPDAATNALRRQVIRRAGLVRARTRCKNQVHAILHRNLVPRCPASDLFGIKGRRWLAEQILPADERAAVAGLLRQPDFTGEELRLLDAELSTIALADDEQVGRADTHATIGIGQERRDDRPKLIGRQIFKHGKRSDPHHGIRIGQPPASEFDIGG
jgi:transposase